MEATLNALSIAQSMLDEAMQRSFDEKTIGKIAYTYTDITQPLSLGPESGEAIMGIDSAYTGDGGYQDYKSKQAFDDVDDYNGYRRRVWDTRMGYFYVTDSVKYVKETNPNAESSTATFYKVIVVVVSHPNLPRANDTSSVSLPIVLRDVSVYRQYF
jgi:hypothetical protein